MLKTSTGEHVFDLIQPITVLDDAERAIFPLENALIIVDRICYGLPGIRICEALIALDKMIRPDTLSHIM